MKKSWKLILIALLAALLVCTCMSAIAEDKPGHGEWSEGKGVEDHEITVGWRMIGVEKHHDTCLSSKVNGQWGGIAVNKYEKYCTVCGFALGEYEYREEFEPCFYDPENPDKVVESTCTEAGSKTWVCDECGKEIVEATPAHGHKPRESQEWVVVKQPTCYSLGWRENVCRICGEKYGENIEMIPHKLGVVVITPATCTTNKVCQNGCQNPGCTYRTGDTWETPNTKLNHGNPEKDQIKHEEVPAKCETAGMTAYTECKLCGQIIKGKKEVIPALGHLYTGGVDVIQEPTCQLDGLYVYKCSREEELCNEDHGKLVNQGKVGHAHPDSTWIVNKAPTCMSIGYRVNYCKFCGGDPITEELPVVEHKFTVTVGTPVAPTCTKDGSQKLACEYECGETITKVIPAKGHTAKKTWSYDRYSPTCENDMHAWVECAECGAHLKDVTIPKLGHHWLKDAGKDANLEPTCTEPGIYNYHCENQGAPIDLYYIDEKGNEITDHLSDGWLCGEHKTEVVPAKGHDYKVETTPATCTEAGKEVKTCKVCGDVVTTEIPALGHDYKTETVAPTCTKAGSETVACSRCGDVKSSKTIDALGHKAGEAEVTKAATCTEKGTKVTKCTVCGETLKTEEIAAMGHKAGDPVVTAATCTKAGSKVTKCTVCGETLKTEEIAALGHKAGDPVVTAATCTKAGSKVTKCSVCGETLKTEEIPALGHKEEVTETAATCTKAGSKVTKCSVCGETLKTEEIPALGHKEEVTETAATCTKAGSKVTKCSVCGETLKTEEIPALGHKEEVTETAATCTEAGSKVTKCTVCGETLKTEEIPAPGHVPGKEKIEQNMGNTYCTVCGKLLKQRKISSGSSNSGSSAPVASAPVIYNGTINAVGIVASELGGNGSALVTPIDLSTDGTFTYSLVAGDKYVVGTLTVTVSGGKATVTYAVKTGVTVSAEGLSIFANAEALKAGTATTAAFNAEIDPAGDTKIILAVNLVGSFDVSIADAYTADAAQIATMKALVD